MNNVLLCLFGISNLLALITIYSYFLHMFQLNSYRPSEFFVWVRKNIGMVLGRILGFVLLVPFLIFMGKAGLVIGCIVNLVSFKGNFPGKSKKPFVVTQRVLRLIFTISLLYAASVPAVFLLGPSLTDSLTVSPAVSMIVSLIINAYGIFAVLVILAGNLLNRPIELSINQVYIHSAGKMLAAMPNLIVIGVTGSYGKTSVKNFLEKLLSAKYNVLMTPGNMNTTLGVVRTIREQLLPQHEIFICEMGARHVGDIKEICDLVHPDIGIIVSVDAQHLETFKTMENIVKTKYELADSIPPEGTVYLNLDSEQIVLHPIQKNIVSFGISNEDADFRAFDVQVNEKGSAFKMKLPDGSVLNFSTHLLGSHNVLNIAGAVAVAYHMGVPADSIVSRVRQLKPVPHRLQLVKTHYGAIIDDAYNSNPAGSKAALDVLGSLHGVKVLVTPGMIELGDKHEELNKEFGKYAAAAADYIVLIGKRQTLPIYSGVRSTDFPESHLFVVGTLQEAMTRVNGIRTAGDPKIVLLENDLPDNYS